MNLNNSIAIEKIEIYFFIAIPHFSSTSLRATFQLNFQQKYEFLYLPMLFPRQQGSLKRFKMRIIFFEILHSFYLLLLSIEYSFFH